MVPMTEPISGAASGIDLNSDELCILAEHPNCFGAKVDELHLSVSGHG